MDRQPGRELPKEYREIALELVTNQGWRYRWQGRHGGHPQLIPADSTKPILGVPTTPSDKRAIRNFATAVRQRGGKWPP